MTPSRFCENCGAALSAQGRFCSVCGHAVAGTSHKVVGSSDGPPIEKEGVTVPEESSAAVLAKDVPGEASTPSPASNAPPRTGRNRWLVIGCAGAAAALLVCALALFVVTNSSFNPFRGSAEEAGATLAPPPLSLFGLRATQTGESPDRQTVTAPRVPSGTPVAEVASPALNASVSPVASTPVTTGSPAAQSQAGSTPAPTIDETAGTPTPTASPSETSMPTDVPTTGITGTPAAMRVLPQGVLFDDDFASQQISESNGWYFGSNGVVSHTWSPNRLTVSVQKTLETTYNLASGEYQDFAVETEAQVIEGGNAWIGLLFKFAGSEDKVSYYEFMIRTTGVYTMWVVDNGVSVEPGLIPLETSSTIHKGSDLNKIGVVVEGSRITAYINRVPVKTIYDTHLTGGGKVGLVAGSLDAAATVAFNRFTVLTVEKAESEWGAGTSTPTLTIAPVPTAPRIAISIQKYDYSQWGRPEGMVKPNGICGHFDDGHPVKKLTASLHVVNKSGSAMKDWYGYFYKPDGNKGYTCYQGYDTVPDIPAGGSLDITFSVYIESNEIIDRGYVYDSQVGRSNTLRFP